MTLVAICPKDKKHGVFVNSALVAQNWQVDRFGNFEDLADEHVQTTHKPDVGNTWFCTTCGAEAKVHEVGEHALVDFLREEGLEENCEIDLPAVSEPERVVMYFDEKGVALAVATLPAFQDVETLKAHIDQYAKSRKFPDLSLEISADVATVVVFSAPGCVVVSLKYKQLRAEVGRVWALLLADRADDAMWAAHALTKEDERNAGLVEVDREDGENKAGLYD